MSLVPLRALRSGGGGGKKRGSIRQQYMKFTEAEVERWQSRCSNSSSDSSHTSSADKDEWPLRTMVCQSCFLDFFGHNDSIDNSRDALSQECYIEELEAYEEPEFEELQRW